MDKFKKEKVERTLLASELTNDLCEFLNKDKVVARALKLGKAFAIKDGSLEHKFFTKLDTGGHFLVYYGGRYGISYAHMFKLCWADRKGFKISNPDWPENVIPYVEKMIDKYRNKI